MLDGTPATPFLEAGDTVRIWMDDGSGHSIFGAIAQQVVAAWRARAVDWTVLVE